MRGRGIPAAVALALASAIFVLAPAGALGAPQDRYAEPNGNGIEPCMQIDPCSLEDAVNNDTLGSDVRLLPGTYELSNELTLAGGTSLVTDSTPVTIHSTAMIGVHIAASSGSSSIGYGVNIDHEPSSNAGFTAALQLENGSASGITVDTTGGDYACFVQGSLSNALCRNDLGGGVAAGLFSPGAASGSLSNVTARSSGYALFVSSTTMSGNVELTARNVIADGDSEDLGGTAPLGGTANINIDFSSFDPGKLNFGAPASATLGTHNTGGAVLAADGLHELPSSPSIDAGDDLPLVDDFDLDGDDRTQGNALDIGADEADGVAPQTKITKKPPRKTRRKTGAFKFMANEADSTFECKLDRKPFSTCASGKKYKHLKSGRHKFQVRATDDFGNQDASPASYAWTIKKPKRHHH